MKTVLDFLGQLWLRFLKPDGDRLQGSGCESFRIFKRSKRVSSFPAIYGVVTRMGRERPGKRSGTTGLLRTVMGGRVSSLDARLGLTMDGFEPNARK